MHNLPARKGPNTVGVRAAAPDPPDWLPDEGRSEWRRVVEATSAYPTWIQSADLAALTAYCVSWSTWVAAAKDVGERGPLVPARSSADKARGALVKNPSLQVMRDVGGQLRAWAVQLGFTPDSRGRVDLGAFDDDDSELQRIFGRPPRN